MAYNSNDVNVIFKEIIQELSNPIIEYDDLNNVFKFISNDLKPLYENNNDISMAIKYFNDMMIELNANETSREKLYELTLIVDKYLCVTPENKNYIESKYAIIQYMMQACFNQILQQLFKINNKKNMDINDIDDAINLFKNTFSDIMEKAKGYKISDKFIEV
jgi:hypothetical protein